MNGQRVLEQVIRTQTALAEPDFDLDAILRDVADEARALTGAEAAVVEAPDGAVITSSARRRRRRPVRSSIAVALPDGGDRGVLKVYSGGRRGFGAEDRRVLELLAGLVWSALTRAALPPHVRRPPTS
jgi:GAF domain-containing protein